LGSLRTGEKDYGGKTKCDDMVFKGQVQKSDSTMAMSAFLHEILSKKQNLLQMDFAASKHNRTAKISHYLCPNLSLKNSHHPVPFFLFL